MKEVKINLQKNLPNGTLVWIYGSNKKVYHSSKRFDTADFSEHDSNFLGDIKEVFPKENRQRASVVRLLGKSERIYGICLNEEGISKADSVKVQFYPTWEKMVDFAEAHFTEYDLLAAKKEEEESRKQTARSEWLERGRQFLKNNKVTPKET